MLRRRLAEEPSDVPVLLKLAEILGGRGQNADAIALLRRALIAQPDLSDVRLQLARLLDESGDTAEALAELSMIGATRAGDFDVRSFTAALLGKLKRHDEEIELYRDLVRKHPRNPGLFMSLGNALKTIGNTPEAVLALRKATRICPTFGEAWWSLANLKTVRLDERDVRAMSKALRSEPCPGDLIHLHFSLGKALEDRGEFADAFHHYAEGNRLQLQAQGPVQTRVTEFVDRSIANYSESLFQESQGAGHPSDAPIFVLGLQRSGSTLIEQILASHSDIEGTSELTIIPQLWIELAKRGSPFEQLKTMAPTELATLGAEYLRRSEAYRSSGRSRFVDKLPANWMYAGFIRLILPNAKIIDARRHPMACGFSNFRQLYASGVSFAYSLESIGTFYADYLRLMDHFVRVQPTSIHRVINEELIESPRNEVERLLAHVGVAFEPDCLEFHKTRRAIETPSAEQVRRPLNRDGVDSWLPFEEWLGPLKLALGPALETWAR